MKKKGAVDLVALGIFIALTVLIPATVKLVQQNQENRSRAAQECHNETRNVCAEYQEECHDEQYSCQTCGAYEQVCQKVNKSCVVGEKDDGRPIYGTCEEEECHDGACSFWENGNCTRNKCSPTSNCLRWENQTEQVCNEVSVTCDVNAGRTCLCADGGSGKVDCNGNCGSCQPPTAIPATGKTCSETVSAGCTKQGKTCVPDDWGGSCGGAISPSQPPAPGGLLPNGDLRCPGPNCDKCQAGVFWGAGCDDFCKTHPGDAKCYPEIAVPNSGPDPNSFRCANGGGNCDQCGKTFNGVVWFGTGCIEFCRDHPKDAVCFPPGTTPPPINNYIPPVPPPGTVMTDITNAAIDEEVRKFCAGKSGSDLNSCRIQIEGKIKGGFYFDSNTGGFRLRKDLIIEHCKKNNLKGINGFSDDGSYYYSCETGNPLGLPDVISKLCKNTNGDLVNWESCNSLQMIVVEDCGQETGKAYEVCVSETVKSLNTTESKESTRQITEKADATAYCNTTADKQKCVNEKMLYVYNGYDVDPKTGTTKFVLTAPTDIRQLCPPGIQYQQFAGGGAIYDCFTGTPAVSVNQIAKAMEFDKTGTNTFSNNSEKDYVLNFTSNLVSNGSGGFVYHYPNPSELRDPIVSKGKIIQIDRTTYSLDNFTSAATTALQDFLNSTRSSGIFSEAELNNIIGGYIAGDKNLTDFTGYTALQKDLIMKLYAKLPPPAVSSGQTVPGSVSVTVGPGFSSVTDAPSMDAMKAAAAKFIEDDKKSCPNCAPPPLATIVIADQLKDKNAIKDHLFPGSRPVFIIVDSTGENNDGLLAELDSDKLNNLNDALAGYKNAVVILGNKPNGNFNGTGSNISTADYVNALLKIDAFCKNKTCNFTVALPSFAEKGDSGFKDSDIASAKDYLDKIYGNADLKKLVTGAIVMTPSSKKPDETAKSASDWIDTLKPYNVGEIILNVGGAQNDEMLKAISAVSDANKNIIKSVILQNLAGGAVPPVNKPQVAAPAATAPATAPQSGIGGIFNFIADEFYKRFNLDQCATSCVGGYCENRTGEQISCTASTGIYTPTAPATGTPVPATPTTPATPTAPGVGPTQTPGQFSPPWKKTPTPSSQIIDPNIIINVGGLQIENNDGTPTITGVSAGVSPVIALKDKMFSVDSPIKGALQSAFTGASVTGNKGYGFYTDKETGGNIQVEVNVNSNSKDPRYSIVITDRTGTAVYYDQGRWADINPDLRAGFIDTSIDKIKEIKQTGFDKSVLPLINDPYLLKSVGVNNTNGNSLAPANMIEYGSLSSEERTSWEEKFYSQSAVGRLGTVQEYYYQQTYPDAAIANTGVVVDLLKKSYDKTLSLGCVYEADKWSDDCKSAFSALVKGDVKVANNQGFYTAANLGAMAVFTGATLLQPELAGFSLLGLAVDMAAVAPFAAVGTWGQQDAKNVVKIELENTYGLNLINDGTLNQLVNNSLTDTLNDWKKREDVRINEQNKIFKAAEIDNVQDVVDWYGGKTNLDQYYQSYLYMQAQSWGKTLDPMSAKTQDQKQKLIDEFNTTLGKRADFISGIKVNPLTINDWDKIEGLAYLQEVTGAVKINALSSTLGKAYDSRGEELNQEFKNQVLMGAGMTLGMRALQAGGRLAENVAAKSVSSTVAENTWSGISKTTRLQALEQAANGGKVTLLVPKDEGLVGIVKAFTKTPAAEEELVLTATRRVLLDDGTWKPIAGLSNDELTNLMPRIVGLATPETELIAQRAVSAAVGKGGPLEVIFGRILPWNRAGNLIKANPEIIVTEAEKVAQQIAKAGGDTNIVETIYRAAVVNARPSPVAPIVLTSAPAGLTPYVSAAVKGGNAIDEEAATKAMIAALEAAKQGKPANEIANIAGNEFARVNGSVNLRNDVEEMAKILAKDFEAGKIPAAIVPAPVPPAAWIEPIPAAPVAVPGSTASDATSGLAAAARGFGSGIESANVRTAIQIANGTLETSVLSRTEADKVAIILREIQDAGGSLEGVRLKDGKVVYRSPGHSDKNNFIIYNSNGTKASEAYGASLDLFRDEADSLFKAGKGTKIDVAPAIDKALADIPSMAPQCVTGDTQLTLANGNQVRIDWVKAGMSVMTYDEKTGKFIPSTVEALMDKGVQPIYKLTTETGKTIRTTSEHPYLVLENNWQKVKDLTVGQYIKTVDGWPASNASGEAVAGWEKIISIEILPPEQVYDISISGTHNFLGNGIVAHNTSISKIDITWGKGSANLWSTDVIDGMSISTLEGGSNFVGAQVTRADLERIVGTGNAGNFEKGIVLIKNDAGQIMIWDIDGAGLKLNNGALALDGKAAPIKIGDVINLPSGKNLVFNGDSLTVAGGAGGNNAARIASLVERNNGKLLITEADLEGLPIEELEKLSDEIGGAIPNFLVASRTQTEIDNINLVKRIISNREQMWGNVAAPPVVRVEIPTVNAPTAVDELRILPKPGQNIGGQAVQANDVIIVTAPGGARPQRITVTDDGVERVIPSGSGVKLQRANGGAPVDLNFGRGDCSPCALAENLVNARIIESRAAATNGEKLRILNEAENYAKHLKGAENEPAKNVLLAKIDAERLAIRANRASRDLVVESSGKAIEGIRARRAVPQATIDGIMGSADPPGVKKANLQALGFTEWEANSLFDVTPINSAAVLAGGRANRFNFENVGTKLGRQIENPLNQFNDFRVTRFMSDSRNGVDLDLLQAEQMRRDLTGFVNQGNAPTVLQGRAIDYLNDVPPLKTADGFYVIYNDGAMERIPRAQSAARVAEIQTNGSVGGRMVIGVSLDDSFRKEAVDAALQAGSVTDGIARIEYGFTKENVSNAVNNNISSVKTILDAGYYVHWTDEKNIPRVTRVMNPNDPRIVPGPRNTFTFNGRPGTGITNANEHTLNIFEAADLVNQYRNQIGQTYDYNVDQIVDNLSLPQAIKDRLKANLRNQKNDWVRKAIRNSIDPEGTTKQTGVWLIDATTGERYLIDNGVTPLTQDINLDFSPDGSPTVIKVKNKGKNEITLTFKRNGGLVPDEELTIPPGQTRGIGDVFQDETLITNDVDNNKQVFALTRKMDQNFQLGARNNQIPEIPVPWEGGELAGKPRNPFARTERALFDNGQNRGLEWLDQFKAENRGDASLALEQFTDECPTCWVVINGKQVKRANAVGYSEAGQVTGFLPENAMVIDGKNARFSAGNLDAPINTKTLTQRQTGPGGWNLRETAISKYINDNEASFDAAVSPELERLAGATGMGHPTVASAYDDARFIARNILEELVPAGTPNRNDIIDGLIADFVNGRFLAYEDGGRVGIRFLDDGFWESQNLRILALSSAGGNFPRVYTRAEIDSWLANGVLQSPLTDREITALTTSPGLFNSYDSEAVKAALGKLRKLGAFNSDKLTNLGGLDATAKTVMKKQVDVEQSLKTAAAQRHFGINYPKEVKWYSRDNMLKDAETYIAGLRSDSALGKVSYTSAEIDLIEQRMKWRLQGSDFPNVRTLEGGDIVQQEFFAKTVGHDIEPPSPEIYRILIGESNERFLIDYGKVEIRGANELGLAPQKIIPATEMSQAQINARIAQGYELVDKYNITVLRREYGRFIAAQEFIFDNLRPQFDKTILDQGWVVMPYKTPVNALAFGGQKDWVVYQRNAKSSVADSPVLSVLTGGNTVSRWWEDVNIGGLRIRPELPFKSSDGWWFGLVKRGDDNLIRVRGEKIEITIVPTIKPSDSEIAKWVKRVPPLVLGPIVRYQDNLTLPFKYFQRVARLEIGPVFGQAISPAAIQKMGTPDRVKNLITAAIIAAWAENTLLAGNTPILGGLSPAGIFFGEKENASLLYNITGGQLDYYKLNCDTREWLSDWFVVGGIFPAPVDCQTSAPVQTTPAPANVNTKPGTIPVDPNCSVADQANKKCTKK